MTVCSALRQRLDFAWATRENGGQAAARDLFSGLAAEPDSEVRNEATWGLALTEESLGNHSRALAFMEAVGPASWERLACCASQPGSAGRTGPLETWGPASPLERQVSGRPEQAAWKAPGR
jgi:hypothetical protein